MPKKVCPNGHWYDPSIYGDQCPMCPAPGASMTPPPMGGAPMGGAAVPPSPQASPETHIAGGMFGGGGAAASSASPHTQVAGGGMMGGPAAGAPDLTGPTVARPQKMEQQAGGHTVIRRPGAVKGGNQPQGRRLVGFLVSYNRDENGRAYNIYEGRNFIGRDTTCDISCPDDNQMSSRHMSILYRSVDDKFKFRDEQSSNGTFVNKNLMDEGELHNYDIIRVGSTIFIFIAIPKIG